jgi:hypothetical protein
MRFFRPSPEKLPFGGHFYERCLKTGYSSGLSAYVALMAIIDISINRDTGVRRAIYVMNSGIFNS